MARTSDTKTYVLQLKDGDVRRITIPATWKLTYGNVVPYQGKNSHNGECRVALRIYEGNKENLRAVMTDVVSFRDTSFEIMEKRTEIQRKNVQKKTEQGMKDVIVEARVTEWVNPDKDENNSPNEFLKLTGPDKSSIEF